MRYSIFISLLMFTPIMASGESAQEIKSACQNILNSKHFNEEIALQDDIKTGICWGAFAVMQQVTQIRYNDEPEPVLKVCAPAKSTRTQYVEIFLKYIKEHPEQLHEDFFLIAWHALRAAFPCK